MLSFHHNICRCVKMFLKTISIESQTKAVSECMHYAWEQLTLPLSMPCGITVWTMEVVQHECLSPRVPSHLQFQHGRETGAESKHQILCETRQIWSRDFWNDMMCIWKWGHELCEVFRVARPIQNRHNLTWRREIRASIQFICFSECMI